MIVSRQVEIPFFRSNGSQRRRGFGALAQVIQTSKIPFLRKYVVAAAKRTGADFSEFAAPQIAAVGGKKIKNW